MEKPDEPIFDWNTMIEMTSGAEARAICIALSSVFDAIQMLRYELQELNATRTD